MSVQSSSKTSEITLGNRKLIARSGHVARQASGAVTLQYGETLVLVAVCGSKKAKEGQDFFPSGGDISQRGNLDVLFFSPPQGQDINNPKNVALLELYLGRIPADPMRFS